MTADEKKAYWRTKKKESRQRAGQSGRLKEQEHHLAYQRRRTARLKELETALKKIVSLGHNNDCLFCGFKDRVVKETLKGDL